MCLCSVWGHLLYWCSHLDALPVWSPAMGSNISYNPNILKGNKSSPKELQIFIIWLLNVSVPAGKFDWYDRRNIFLSFLLSS